MSEAAAQQSKKHSYVDPATFTPHFSWKKSGGNSPASESVCCEGVSLRDIAEEAGTPSYVYSQAAIGDAYNELAAGLGALAHTLCFAVKSNGNLAILKYLAGLGSGFDIVSGGELQFLQRIGVAGNPDVQAGGHPHISKGRHEHKFGLDWEQARRLYLAHRDSRDIQWRGISVHIGSQIVALGPFQRALRRLASYVSELRGAGIPLEYLDFGGGLGVRYTNEKIPARKEYARMVAQAIRPLRLHLLLEPGRTIIGPAGVLLTRVLYVKENRGKRFVVVDSAMNDLLRPALYGAIHPITPVTRESENHFSQQRADIVGPVCETGDCFLHDWPLGKAKAGDVLSIWTTGAYGMSQASNYNARCRPAEVLVAGNRYRVIRRREMQSDLLRKQVF